MICDICDKRRMVGNRVSHSNIKTKRTQAANVQRLRAQKDGRVVRLFACTRCIRSGRVAKARSAPSGATAAQKAAPTH